MGKFYQTFKEELTIATQVHPKDQRGGTLPNSVCKTSIILKTRPEKDTTRKENYRLVSLMNTDAKVLNKILANWLDKIQYPFIITLNKLGIEGTYLNIIMAIHDKSTANIILINGEMLKVSALRSWARWGCPLSLLLFNIVLEVIARRNQARKRNKGISIRKEEVKLSLCADDIIGRKAWRLDPKCC